MTAPATMEKEGSGRLSALAAGPSVGAEMGKQRDGTSFLPLIWMLNFKSALRSLMANKLRTVLAMLGMIIGVGAVIAMLAMGAGAQQQILARYQAMGTNTLTVRPAQRGTGGVVTGTQQNLVVEDALCFGR